MTNISNKFALELHRYDHDFQPNENFYDPSEWNEYDGKASAIKLFYKLAGPENHESNLNQANISLNKLFAKKGNQNLSSIPSEKMGKIFYEFGFETLVGNSFQIPANEVVKFNYHSRILFHKKLKILLGMYNRQLQFYSTENELILTVLFTKLRLRLAEEIAKLDDVPEKTSATVYGIGCNSNGALSLITLNVKTTRSDEEYFKLAYPDLNSEKITDFFDDDKATGKLLLFSGEPGTGKTTFIRHLFTVIDPSRKIVLASPELFDKISSPEFSSFVMSNFQNAYLVVEDAEQLLLSRDSARNPISQLLNYTDGLFGDAVNLRVIATFNTETENIDAALLRNGRLHHHEFFRAHSPEQATNFLLKSQNLGTIETEAFIEQRLKENKDISLCDLYAYANEIKKKNENGTK